MNQKRASSESGANPAGPVQKDDPSRDRALLCARGALDKKAENVRILDIGKLSGFADYFMICSALNERQVQAISDSICSVLKKTGVRNLSMEGYQEARWVLIDFGDVVVHVFLDAIRDYYDLETLWSEAPRVQIPAEYYGAPNPDILN